MSDKCPAKDVKAKVEYIGTLLSGEEFDSTTGKSPFEFDVGAGSVIKAWDAGLPTMCVGERAVFVLHPELGYKEKQQDKIPANSAL